jgi:hypothetical protein
VQIENVHRQDGCNGAPTSLIRMLLLDPAFAFRVSQFKEHPQLGSLQRWLVGSWPCWGLTSQLELIISREDEPRADALDVDLFLDGYKGILFFLVTIIYSHKFAKMS